jgi:hypothetical protein
MEQIPSEITPRGIVGTHPRSPGAPGVHHQMKVNLQVLVRTLISEDMIDLSSRSIQYPSAHKRAHGV